MHFMHPADQANTRRHQRNCLRVGRPTRRNLTTAGSEEAIDCVANLITAVTCFSHLNLLLVDPTSARNGIGWPFFRSEDWNEWVDYIASSHCAELADEKNTKLPCHRRALATDRGWKPI
jgi:hypothetical protein